MTDSREAICAHVDRTAEAPVAFLQGLIRASRGGEAAVQRCVADRLRQIGCVVEEIRYRPADVVLKNEFAAEPAMNLEERDSVVGRLPAKGSGRSLIFFAHPDGEPVRNVETWRHDPFAAIIDDGRLYGWGVADDLAGVAAAVAALEALVGAGLRPLGDVIVASTPSKRHARGVAALMNHGFGADAAIYLHPAESGKGMHEIKAFAAGQLEFRIIVQGQFPPTTQFRFRDW